MSDKKVKNIFIDGPIQPIFISQSIAKHQSKTNIGAHSIFLGQVRSDVVNGQVVRGITYTTYPEMALSNMADIREQVFNKYEITCAHVHHSLGFVAAGEICLFVFTSARHRKAAILACEEMVELIKASLPIWGREEFENDTYQWKANK